jgi:hypothetical protein
MVVATGALTFGSPHHGMYHWGFNASSFSGIAVLSSCRLLQQTRDMAQHRLRALGMNRRRTSGGCQSHAVMSRVTSRYVGAPILVRMCSRNGCWQPL